MSYILDIYAREILDSRGTPTVEVEVVTSSGAAGTAAVPSGASTGEREAVEKRDGDEERFSGKGVRQAVDAVNTVIRDALLYQNVCDQAAIDALLIALDGSENKSHLGANALLGTSLAVAQAAADHVGQFFYEYVASLYQEKTGCETDISLPVPLMNLINGGAHAHNNLDIQEFMIVPIGGETMFDRIRMGAEVFATLKKLLQDAGHTTSVGDEGGFAPNFDSNDDALDWLMRAIQAAGYTPGRDISLALDVAASELIDEQGYYQLQGEKRTLTSSDLVTYYTDLCDKYPIVSIEDGMGENDVSGWQKLTAALGERIQLVGDDNFVTQKAELQKGIDAAVANSILIKLNQVGTLSETLETMATAEHAGYSCIVSHRSGETEDVSIAHLAVGTGCGQIKTGSLSRSDRTAKYNELLRIAEIVECNAS